MPRKFLLSLLFLCLMLAGPRRAFTQTPDPERLIPFGVDGAPPNGWMDSPAISWDGRFVVFASDSANLVAGDTNGVMDIFVHDRLLRETRLVSVSTEGIQGNAASTAPDISGNGRIVVFESEASNLVFGDNNGFSDIFAHDLLTGITARMSVSAEGSEANNTSLEVSIDRDGRYMAFASAADTLIKNDGNDTTDIFIKDRLTDNVILASRLSAGSQANDISSDPRISGDGRFVTYRSAADNLVPSDANRSFDIFLYHRVLAETTLISRNDFGDAANNWSETPDVSNTAGRVVYISPATNLASGVGEGASIFMRDRRNGRTLHLASFGRGQPPTDLKLSPDGSTVVVVKQSIADSYDLLTLDVQTGITRNLASVNYETGFDLTFDGSQIVFAVPDPENSDLPQIFLSSSELPQSPYFLAGRATNSLGTPLALVTITDNFGNSTRSDADGYWQLSGYGDEEVTLIPEKEGYSFNPETYTFEPGFDIASLQFTAFPADIIEEARLDIGMPYSFYRGCENPWDGCGGPFHGFSAGYCTDLVLDAYWYGADFNIQFELEQDAKANPQHFYRWRNARNVHDMWRYFSYSGQMLRNDEPYLPGDIVFFDWSEDGELDHVALVSVVTADGLAEMMVDATGVIDANPTGLAAELEWEPFHDATVRGHARWHGYYEPFVQGFPAGMQVLQMALGSPDVALRVVDEAGRALSLTENGIPGGRYVDLVWEEVVGVVDPLRVGNQFTVELTGHGAASTAYQFTVQTMEGAKITGRVIANGVISPREVRTIPVILSLNEDGSLEVRAVITYREAKIWGELQKR